MITRRTLLRGSASTLAGSLAGALLARPLHALMPRAVTEFQELPAAGDDRIRMLITTAVDAAKSAGATYADARLTFSQQIKMFGQDINDNNSRGAYPSDRSEMMAFGVRAQYNGYWGFASSPMWTKAEAARLGRAAMESAKVNVSGRPRDLEMAPTSGATSGDWSMPVTDDPFAMAPDEIFDYISSLYRHMATLESEEGLGTIEHPDFTSEFFRQQKAFGSSDGQLVTQRVYRTSGSFGFSVVDRDGEHMGMASGVLRQLAAAGAGRGFELLRTPHTHEWLRQLYEELQEERRLPVVPVDVGKYPVLLHSGAIAEVVKKSVGIATEIDRVMGYEANSTGTSYIIDPEESLGTLQIGAPIMRVTATRSLPGGLTQAKWDDEGVTCQNFDLVNKGILTNLHRNREGTAWMKGYLTKTGQPVRSNGCAYALDASDAQAVHPSDLVLHPDPDRDTTLTQLREQIDLGVEIKTSSTSMDFQQSTGLLVGESAFLIKKGKRVARLASAGLRFRTPELWGNLQALGGPSSVMPVGTSDVKSGNPWTPAYSTVSTPPALFKAMSVINPSQKI